MLNCIELIKATTAGLCRCVYTNNAYPKFNIMVSVAKWMREGLIPSWIQVLVNHFAFIELLPFKFELHIWITCT